MRNKYVIILTIFLTAALTACSSGPKDLQDRTDTPIEQGTTDGQTEEASPSATQETSPQTTEKPQESLVPMATAYLSVLEGIYYDARWPDGTMFALVPPAGDGQTAGFAVYDIDFDGQEELIIEHSDTYMAGMVTAVYGYDSAAGSVFEQFCEFPSLRFYNNGIVEADWSHNQDPASADDFWPYTLYQYDPQTDSYTPIASVHARDLSRCHDKDSSLKAADTDGDGILYFIIEDGTPYKDGFHNPIDYAEYAQWHNSYINGAETVPLHFTPIDLQNIYTAFGMPVDQEKYDRWREEWEAQFQG